MSATIYLIYGRPNTKKGLMTEGHIGEYGALYVFDQDGVFDQEVLNDSYHQVFQVKNSMNPFVGPFDSIDEISRWAFSLCELKQVDRAILMSHEEYNEALEESQNKDELLERMSQMGRSVENLEVRKKGLLGKIFR